MIRGRGRLLARSGCGADPALPSLRRAQPRADRSGRGRRQRREQAHRAAHRDPGHRRPSPRRHRRDDRYRPLRQSVEGAARRSIHPRHAGRFGGDRLCARRRGRMIDGVLVDQIEARRAYEARLRERIDPGLGEVSRAFEFKTRVYPIEAGSSRTVRVRFVTPIDPRRGYELPLSRADEIGRLSISVEASGTAAPPRLSLPGVAQAEWRREADSHLFLPGAANVRLDGMLAVRRCSAPRRSSSGGTLREGLFRAARWRRRQRRPGAASGQVACFGIVPVARRRRSRGRDRPAARLSRRSSRRDRADPVRRGAAERLHLSTARAVVDRLRRITYRGAPASRAAARRSTPRPGLLSPTPRHLRKPAIAAPGMQAHRHLHARDADRPWLNALARVRRRRSASARRRQPLRASGPLTRQVPRVGTSARPPARPDMRCWTRPRALAHRRPMRDTRIASGDGPGPGSSETDIRAGPGRYLVRRGRPLGCRPDRSARRRRGGGSRHPDRLRAPPFGGRPRHLLPRARESRGLCRIAHRAPGDVSGRAARRICRAGRRAKGR